MINLTTDLHRIRDIKELIDRGFLGQILLGQDLCFKDMYSCYGGYGYAHLLENAVPLMGDMGLTEREIDALLVDNPRRFLDLCGAGGAQSSLTPTQRIKNFNGCPSRSRSGWW